MEKILVVCLFWGGCHHPNALGGRGSAMGLSLKAWVCRMQHASGPESSSQLSNLPHDNHNTNSARARIQGTRLNVTLNGTSHHTS